MRASRLHKKEKKKFCLYKRRQHPVSTNYFNNYAETTQWQDVVMCEIKTTFLKDITCCWVFMQRLLWSATQQVSYFYFYINCSWKRIISASWSQKEILCRMQMLAVIKTGNYAFQVWLNSMLLILFNMLIWITNSRHCLINNII